MNLKKQLAKLYALEFLGSFNLTDSIWLVLLTSRGFSLWQAGVAEGLFHLMSFVCEIPSGMLADVYGRRRVLVASWLCALGAAVLMLVSHSFLGVCLSFMLGALGYNLESGTRQAITYESLAEQNDSARYLSVSATQNAIWSITGSVSRLLAGAALALGYRACYVLRMGTSLLGAGTAARLREPQTEVQRPHTPLRSLPAALKQQAVNAAAFLRSAPRAGLMMLAAAGVSAPVTLCFFFLQQRLSDTGSPFWLGPLLCVVSLGAVAGAKLAVVMGRLRQRRAAVLCALGAAAGMALCAAPLPLAQAAGGFVMFAADTAFATLTDARLNAQFSDGQRATLVSVSTMCISLLMMVLSPVLGALCTTLGTAGTFLLCGGCVAAATACAALATRRKTPA